MSQHGWISMLVLAALAAPALAHEEGSSNEAGVRADLLASLDDAERKLVALAEAIPQDKYGWRPTPEVRTVSEVFMHVAGGNYYLSSLVGVAPPEGAGRDLEKETDKAKVLATLKASFEHARKAIGEVPAGKLAETISFGGGERSGRGILVVLVSHGHEHLGQAIAYARSIGVVPPWSAAGG
jgi:uncharacterized damage-inducible protein DinB